MSSNRFVKTDRIILYLYQYSLTISTAANLMDELVIVIINIKQIFITRNFEMNFSKSVIEKCDRMRDYDYHILVCIMEGCEQSVVSIFQT